MGLLNHLANCIFAIILGANTHIEANAMFTNVMLMRANKTTNQGNKNFLHKLNDKLNPVRIHEGLFTVTIIVYMNCLPSPPVFTWTVCLPSPPLFTWTAFFTITTIVYMNCLFTVTTIYQSHAGGYRIRKKCLEILLATTSYTLQF